MKRIALLIALSVSVLLGATQPRTYQTNFPATENPISENGNWNNGETAGPNRGNIQTTPGLAFGTVTSPNCATVPTTCNDSVATLTGTWGSNQTACGTVFLSPSLSRNSTFYEIELHTNMTITAGNITGYEFNYSMRNDGNQYAQLVVWKGPLGSFQQLAQASGTPPAIGTGDILCASRNGAVLTLKRTPKGSTTASTLLTFSDSSYTNGAPGIGQFNQGGTLADNALYGFSSFQATDNGSNNPAPPTNLRVTDVQ
jgi:hypothetical protein